MFMKTPKNLSGNKFGKWNVIDKADPIIGIDNRRKKQRYTHRWNCICECGRTAKIIQDHLLSGRSSKCRNCKAEDRKLNGKISSVLFAHIKHSARKREIDFDHSISKEYLQSLYEKQNKKCAITGLDIVFANSIKEHKNGKTTASLDRIDSNLGYKKNNIQWVHKDINKMKSDLCLDRFIELCKAVCNGILIVDKT